MEENNYQNYWNEKVTKDGDYPEYLSGGGAHHLFKAIEHILSALPRNAKVLDIGCGSGFSTYFFYPFCKEIHAIDYSEKAIENAKKKYPHISFLNTPVTELPFKDDEFDVIICQGILHHLIKIKSINDQSREYLYEAIKEIDRVGKGFLIIDEANALNPLRKYKEHYYYPKINRNEWSYALFTWKKIFNSFSYEITDYKYHTFIPAESSKKLISWLKPIESILEITPLVNKLAGGIFFVCKKKDD